MKFVARCQRLHHERLVRDAPPQDEACAFLHFEIFVFFFVRLEREVPAFADHEMFFDARMFMHSDDHPAPWRADDSVPSAIDAIEQLGELRRCFAYRSVVKLLAPQPACLPAVMIECVARIDSRLFAQLTRDRSKTRIRALMPAFRD